MCVHLCDRVSEARSTGSGVESGNPVILKLLCFEHLPHASLFAVCRLQSSQ